MKNRIALVCFLSLFFVVPVYAGEAIIIESPWSRAMPPGVKNGAAFFILKNNGSNADRLVGAAADIAENVEVHSHEHVDGVMRMRQVEGVDLAPGGSVEFKPGGYHVMFIGLNTDLAVGFSFPLTLKFENSADQTVEVVVKKMEMMH